MSTVLGLPTELVDGITKVLAAAMLGKIGPTCCMDCNFVASAGTLLPSQVNSAESRLS